MKDNIISVKILWQLANDYFALNLERTKLSFVKKLTILFSLATFYFIAIILTIIIFIFLSMALCQILHQTIQNISYTYLIIAGLYVALLVLIYILRKWLFLNPISRFLSRLIFNQHKNT